MKEEVQSARALESVVYRDSNLEYMPWTVLLGFLMDGGPYSSDFYTLSVLIFNIRSATKRETD